MNRILGWALRAFASVAILSYLLWQVRASDPDTFVRLASGEPQWGRLSLAWICFAASLMVGWIRWWMLVNGFGVRVSFPAILRLGVLSYMLDFVALGAAGSDVVRAVILARGQPGRRVAVVSSVFADRAIGLLSLLTFVTAAVSIWGLEGYPAAIRSALSLLRILALGAWLATASLLLFGAPLLSAVASWRLPKLLQGLIERLRVALSLVASVPERIVIALLMSPLITTFQIVGFYLIASSLPGEAPTFGEQAAVVPVALLGGVVPLPADNLGLLDLAVSYLYVGVSAGRVSPGQGLVAVLAYRVVGVVITATGALLYARSGVVAGER